MTRTKRPPRAWLLMMILAVTAGRLAMAQERASKAPSTGKSSALDRQIQLEMESAVAASLQLEQFNIDRLDVPGNAPDRIEIPVVFDDVYTLSLRLHSVRGPDYVVYVQDETGELRPVEPPPVRTYRGTVKEVPGAEVAASLGDHGLTALIELPQGRVLSVQPVTEFLTDAPHGWHVVYDAADVPPGEGHCGSEEFAELPLAPPKMRNHSEPGEGEPLAQAGQTIVDIAFDADVEFYEQNNSSVAQTVWDIERVLNGVTLIYQQDVSIVYWINVMIVRTAEPDPYGSTNAATLHCQFRDFWNANYDNLGRDVAHLMTGKNLDGTVIGRAWASVCNREGTRDECPGEDNLAYGLSQSRVSNSWPYRVAITAHEFGHNFGAGHCNSNRDCRIMCSNIGGCTGILTSFAESARNSIGSTRDGMDCVSECRDAVWVPDDDTPTLRHGVRRACWGGRVNFRPGTYPANLKRLSRRLTLAAPQGSVQIGD